jgi:hypothetical protein
MSPMEPRDIGIAFDRPRLPPVLTPRAPPDRPHGYQVARLRGPRRDVPAARGAGRGVAQAVALLRRLAVRRRRGHPAHIIAVSMVLSTQVSRRQAPGRLRGIRWRLLCSRSPSPICSTGRHRRARDPRRRSRFGGGVRRLPRDPRACARHRRGRFPRVNGVSDHLDASWMLVTEKVFGFLLAALAVQLVLDGLQDVGALHLTGH